jgi:acetylornithine deacetylase/succinyl-diaminopimelate desuccinylase-like protein
LAVLSGWRDLVHELASFERPSASPGERRAAGLIAAALRARGLEPDVEQGEARGGYWWPLGLANVLGVGGALLARGGGPLRRLLGALLAGTAAAAVWDDVGHGRRWFRRALIPSRPTWNVYAWCGPRSAPRTVVFVAHHDAAHSGIVFHPALGRIGPRLMPRTHERSSHTLPILYGVWLGPMLVCAGAVSARSGLLRAGGVVSLLAAGAMCDIGARAVVPGANDNLSAVAVLAALAERLRDRPREGASVLLLSTGSEESFSEGMEAFVRRHGAKLDSDTTEFVCLECVGGSELIVLEGEGMLWMRDYPTGMRDKLASAAARAGVPIRRGLRTVGATDALIAHLAGYRAVTLASVEATKLPLNYHWPSDVPEHLHWRTIEQAIDVCEAFVDETAAGTGHLPSHC